MKRMSVLEIFHDPKTGIMTVSFASAATEWYALILNDEGQIISFEGYLKYPSFTTRKS